MIRFSVVVLAAVQPAVAQVAPLSFESGKQLPLSQGQWTHVVTAARPEARFGNHLFIQCDPASRTVTIGRPGIPAAGLTIITDMASRLLPPDGRISANDPLLDAMAFSRGRFLVASGAGSVLAIPSWPEAARSIEDCRN